MCRPLRCGNKMLEAEMCRAVQPFRSFAANVLGSCSVRTCTIFLKAPLRSKFAVALFKWKCLAAKCKAVSPCWFNTLGLKLFRRSPLTIANFPKAQARNKSGHLSCLEGSGTKQFGSQPADIAESMACFSAVGKSPVPMREIAKRPSVNSADTKS